MSRSGQLSFTHILYCMYVIRSVLVLYGCSNMRNCAFRLLESHKLMHAYYTRRDIFSTMFCLTYCMYSMYCSTLTAYALASKVSLLESGHRSIFYWRVQSLPAYYSLFDEFFQQNRSITRQKRRSTVEFGGQKRKCTWSNHDYDYFTYRICWVCASRISRGLFVMNDSCVIESVFCGQILQ